MHNGIVHFRGDGFLQPGGARVRHLTVNHPNVMSEPIDRPDAGQPARRSLNSFSPFPKSDPRNERKGLRPLGEDPAGTEDLRIHEDPSTVISLGGAGVQSGTNPSTQTSTPTQPPADEAEIQAQRDRDRLLALRFARS